MAASLTLSVHGVGISGVLATRYIKNKMIRRNRRQNKLYLSKHSIAG